MIVTLILVALAMAVRDVLGTLLVVAEAKGRAVAAGTLDSLGDIAQTLCTVFGVGEIIVHGFGLEAGLILLVMCVTSFVTTLCATIYGRQWEATATDSRHSQ